MKSEKELEIEKESEPYTFARTIKNEEIHISQAESGKQGYYCIDCGLEMQAKKGDKKMHHFSHDPKDISIKGKCTYSNETYRHNLAKRILEEIKQIKVPAIYKYPPYNEEGRPNKIRDAFTITAISAKSEITFYENNKGVICWGKKESIDDDMGEYLLIKPDVAFFDSNYNPILLIEIVVTHKVDAEKLSKIRRLGINTIQVTVPKDSPEEIRNNFYTTNRTQWIYNYEQEAATYIRVPEGDSQGIPQIDEFQRELLKSIESYACRKAQIGNLLRGIRKCMETEQYRGIIQSVRDELLRVEGNTERDSDKLRTIQDSHRKQIEERYAREATRLDNEERELSKEEGELDNKNSVLERRYINLEELYWRRKREIGGEQEKLWGDTNNPEERISEIGREEAIISANERIVREQYNQDSRKEAASIEQIEQRRTNLPEQYKNIEEAVGREFESRKEEVRREFEDLRKQSFEAVEIQDFRGCPRLSERIKNILDARRVIDDIETEILTYRKLQAAKTIFDSRSYKDWV